MGSQTRVLSQGWASSSPASRSARALQTTPTDISTHRPYCSVYSDLPAPGPSKKRRGYLEGHSLGHGYMII